MRTDWTSRLMRGYVTLFTASGIAKYPAKYPAEDPDRDADLRRIRTELDAIRVHFPDRA